MNQICLHRRIVFLSNRVSIESQTHWQIFLKQRRLVVFPLRIILPRTFLNLVDQLLSWFLIWPATVSFFQLQFLTFPDTLKNISLLSVLSLHSLLGAFSLCVKFSLESTYDEVFVVILFRQNLAFLRTLVKKIRLSPQVHPVQHRRFTLVFIGHGTDIYDLLVLNVNFKLLLLEIVTHRVFILHGKWGSPQISTLSSVTPIQ